MPSDKIQKTKPICLTIQLPQIAVPAKSFATFNCVCPSIAVGQRVGVSRNPEGISQTDGIHILNSYCTKKDELTIQFDNMTDEEVFSKSGSYKVYLNVI